MAATSVVAIRPGHGDPADIFSIGAPVIGASAPQASPLAAGDASVSTQTGAFSYAYPISVPPGRNGMQPKIALSYSSQAPIYGDIAAGWTISGLHGISRDTSNGRLDGVVRYTSTLTGGRPLVQVNDQLSTGGTSYRAKNDSTWTRYQLLGDSPTNAKWIAYTTDGAKYYFGEAGHGTCATFTHEYAPLTRIVDKFGNEVRYSYTGFPTTECRINFITWGHNANANVQHFATLKFNFFEQPTTCPYSNIPIGSQTSFRTGTKRTSGSTRLLSVVAYAHAPGSVTHGALPASPDHRRTISLGYDSATEACSGVGHSPYRQLTAIQETAWGIDSPQVSLPAVTFEYGSANFNTDALIWPQPASSTQPPWTVLHPAGGATHFNLGWGYRYRTGTGKIPTVEEMMIDIDGDGLPDRLTNTPVISSSKVVRCEAAWQRNLGGGVFEEVAERIALPTLKWSSPGSGAGGAHANVELYESCSLNYQQTRFVNSYQNSGGLGCPANDSCVAGYCQNAKYDCGSPGKSHQPGVTVLSYRWIDMDGDKLVDLVASPTRGGLNSYNFYKGNVNFAQATESPLVFGPFTGGYANCPNPNFTATVSASEPYTMCNGRVPWFVYKNHGNGQFGEPNNQPSPYSAPWPLPTRVLYQPIPLETSASDSAMISYPTGAYQGTVDVDGDGQVDGVRMHSSQTSWSVWRGTRLDAAGQPTMGQFLPASSSAAFSFPTVGPRNIARSEYLADGSYAAGVEGLFDFEGDGLLDHWQWDEMNQWLSIGVNGGTGFQLSSYAYMRPDAEAYAVCGVNCRDTIDTSWPVRAYRWDKGRPADLDLDGRVDIAYKNATLWQSYFNRGGEFGAASQPVGWGFGLAHAIVATAAIGPYPGAPTSGLGDSFSWEIRSDMLDIDGDGIPEGIDFSTNLNGVSSPYLVSKVPTPETPPRLLKKITNGRGASTEIKYAPMSSKTVEQDPLNGKRMPHTLWAVKSLQTKDTVASPQTISDTYYTYADPAFNADDEGRYAFRGFERATTTMPSGAARVETYSFAPDWSGRLVKSVVKAAETPTFAHTIDETVWQERSLFGGVLKTYHPTIRKHYVCANGQSEATCAVPANAAGYSQVTSTLTALATSRSGGSTTPLMWLETSSLQQKGTAAANGDRRADTQHYLYADATNYRLVALSETKLHQTGGSFAMYGKTETKWEDSSVPDSSYRVPWRTFTWIDATSTLETVRDFDLASGNVTAVWKPVQWKQNPNRASNGVSSRFYYDSRKLFLDYDKNELNHSSSYTWEYGTGTKLATYGPNAAPCVTSNSCPTGSPAQEEHRIRVDGLGRMIERFESFGDDTAMSYARHKVEINEYFDGPAARVRHWSAIDVTGTSVRTAEDLTELDGHGRPLRTTLLAQGAAAANQVTTYRYTNAGTLAQVSVPDPTGGDPTGVNFGVGGARPGFLAR